MFYLIVSAPFWHPFQVMLGVLFIQPAGRRKYYLEDCNYGEIFNMCH